MGEMADGSGGFGVGAKEADVVADGTGAKAGDFHASLDSVAESDFVEVFAAGGDHEEYGF